MMQQLTEYANRIEAALGALLPERDDSCQEGEIAPVLNKSMRYSLLMGGKRLRPAMLLAVCDLLGGDPDEAMAYACAVEMIHCYSLVHDDLPGMDDDVIRRGKPTNHVVYGVGQAILAGDGLLNLAYETMLRSALSHPDRLACHVRAMREIALSTGVRGMIAGQSMDLMQEQISGNGVKELEYIQHNKTAALFICAHRAAAHLAGASEEQMRALTNYANAFGLLFQTVDDLLDVEGDEQMLGKSVGKDAQSGKLTAVKVYGLGGARELRQQFLHDGLAALEPFGDRAAFLRELLQNMSARKS
ncbi:polyprenyl synthetase family protein [Eubacteriales bacterium OttesenSCG-928-N13]|nr:polyprenyl synthetase family protein [Eubacteriales bacterium OttesenSCG-928-N13]